MDVSGCGETGGPAPLPVTDDLAIGHGNVRPLVPRPGRLPERCISSHTGLVSTKIIQVARGRDGKHYPSPMPPSPADRIKIIARLHELVHGEGLSEREAQRQLL